jgi:hypothetical protein
MLANADQVSPRPIQSSPGLGDKNVLSKSSLLGSDIIKYLGFARKISSLGGTQGSAISWHRDCG